MSVSLSSSNYITLTPTRLRYVHFSDVAFTKAIHFNAVLATGIRAYGSVGKPATYWDKDAASDVLFDIMVVGNRVLGPPQDVYIVLKMDQGYGSSKLYNIQFARITDGPSAIFVTSLALLGGGAGICCLICCAICGVILCVVGIAGYCGALSRKEMKKGKRNDKNITVISAGAPPPPQPTIIQTVAPPQPTIIQTVATPPAIIQQPAIYPSQTVIQQPDISPFVQFV